MIVRIHSNPTFSVGTMLSCLFLWTGLATAQTATVQGRVTNATDHAALEGVTITNLSMPVAARTDKKGNFNIRANAGDRLKVSLLGFKTIEIAVPSTGNLQIALNEESRQIDEVVVTALGIKRQTRGLTYATQQLDGVQSMMSTTTVATY
ncbi:carboxypeptidase-like regulatory domain-containing protein [Sphingobacterium sp.]|uniref:carboxypeptidase-like regulatory domain-containing protein n=1 Tax=Sphingobacterium sp. TaxID=341027 RepID=UPI0028A2793D|nr:carboxypeptidase-like regulatory domain-containing protein [Sphingobacterium sp.]